MWFSRIIPQQKNHLYDIWLLVKCVTPNICRGAGMWSVLIPPDSQSIRVCSKMKWDGTVLWSTPYIIVFLKEYHSFFWMGWSLIILGCGEISSLAKVLSRPYLSSKTPHMLSSFISFFSPPCLLPPVACRRISHRLSLPSEAQLACHSPRGVGPLDVI